MSNISPILLPIKTTYIHVRTSYVHVVRNLATLTAQTNYITMKSYSFEYPWRRNRNYRTSSPEV